jgi:diguanylate cyclase (GGDEF)-like protein/PAS domain S-box-containing protein
MSPLSAPINRQVHSIVKKHAIYSTTDLDGRITSASDAFCIQTGYTEQELLGETHSKLRSELTDDSFYRHMWETIQQDKIWQGEVQNIRKDGGTYWMRCTIYPLYKQSGMKEGYIAIRDNITREKTIESCAMVDELTQVYNRKKFNHTLLGAFDQFERNEVPFGVVMMDIDNFKQINDRYGHLVGDEVLVSIANAISNQTRPSDLFARWGGEEFALLASNLNEAQLIMVGERLRSRVADGICQEVQKRLRITETITCSFGVTMARKSEGIDHVMNRCDRALYRAKHQGRNRVEIL